jgi:hypothetical protein
MFYSKNWVKVLAFNKSLIVPTIDFSKIILINIIIHVFFATQNDFMNHVTYTIRRQRGNNKSQVQGPLFSYDDGSKFQLMKLILIFKDEMANYFTG